MSLRRARLLSEAYSSMLQNSSARFTDGYTDLIVLSFSNVNPTFVTFSGLFPDVLGKGLLEL